MYINPELTQQREQRLINYLSNREGAHIPGPVLLKIYEPNRKFNDTTINKIMTRLIKRGYVQKVANNRGSSGNAYKVLRNEVSMPKVRQIVRGVGQQGVPSSYKATESEYKNLTKYQIESDRVLVEYIKSHEGIKMGRRELGLVAGLHSSGAISVKLRRLQEAGLINWETAKGYGMYRFWIPKNERKLQTLNSVIKSVLSKGDSRNGEVRVIKPRVITQLEDLQPAKETTSSNVPVKSQEETFVDLLDGFMWDFLKGYGVPNNQYRNPIVLGEAVIVLRAFSEFMKDKANGGKN